MVNKISLLEDSKAQKTFKKICQKCLFNNEI